MRQFYRQEIYGDGACLFRALAGASFFAHCGYNLGRGCGFEDEASLDEVVLNGLTAWLRHHTMQSLCSRGSEAAVLKPRALFDMCHELLAAHRDTPLDLATIRANFRLERLEELGEGTRLFKEIGMTAGTLARSGMAGGESFHGYCRRMQKPTEWGGCGELAVLATEVLQCPVHLFRAVLRDPQEPHLWHLRRAHAWEGGARGAAGADDASAHLLYTGNHYEALLPFSASA